MTKTEQHADHAPHGWIYRCRLWLMWKVSPVQKKTVEGGLSNLEENDHPREYDTAGELRYLLGLKGGSHLAE